MSSLLYPAFNGLVLQPESTIDTSVEGLVTIRACYIGYLSDIETLNFSFGTRHPEFAGVGVDTFRITYKKGTNIGELDVVYKGAFSFGQRYYSMQRSLSAIPIEQASNFSVLATQANGAFYDDNNQFQGWTKGSPYEGLTTIDAPKYVISESSITSFPDTSGTLGDVESPPGPFSVGKCVFMGNSCTQEGGVVFRNVRTWESIPTVKIPAVANPSANQ